MTRYTVEGKGSTDIHDSHFLYEGGEAKIYAKGDTVYKIYIDPKKMISTQKIQELATIKNPNVIKPECIITNTRNRKVGYTMRYIKNSYPLCKVFTFSFKNKNKISDQMILDFIAKMQLTASHIHSKNCLIVDFNEMNCLLSQSFNDVYFIDVDSYQTPSFPATAIMDSIRDRHSKTFSENTDWFSFAILSFHMLIGVHPYKGKHPSIKSIDDRMKKNLSVFNKDISVPKICKPLTIIPKGFRDWYKALFEDGKRIPPPDGFQAKINIIITPSIIESNERLDISLEKEYESNIIGYLSNINNHIVITEQFIHIGEHIQDPVDKSTHFCLSTQLGRIVCAHVDIFKNMLILRHAEINMDIHHKIGAESIMSYNNSLYVKNQDSIGEVIFVESGNLRHATTKKLTSILPAATTMYEGCAIQNLLGAWVVSIFPDVGKSHQVTLPELSKCKVVDAKYDNQVLFIVTHSKGKYDKFILKFNNNFTEYDIRKTTDINYQGINFITLDNGVVISVNEDEELEIFSNKIKNNDLKVIKNSVISGNMKLYKNGTSVLFTEKNKLYRVSMKQR